MKILLSCILFSALSLANAQTNVYLDKGLFSDQLVYTSETQGIQKIYLKTHNVSSAPKNTVILLHGCGGVSNHTKIWIEQLTAWNYNVVVIDSFTSRGMPNGACTVVPYIRQPSDDRVEDLFATAKWIQQQSWNKSKPAVLGFSHGGNTVYLASNKKETKELLSSGVSFYPWCWHYVNPDKSWPMQIHVGSEDEWNSPASCIRNENRRSEKLEFFIYQGAHHSWDMPGVDAKIPLATGSGLSAKTVRFDPEANILSRQRTKSWFDRHFGYVN